MIVGLIFFYVLSAFSSDELTVESISGRERVLAKQISRVITPFTSAIEGKVRAASPSPSGYYLERADLDFSMSWEAGILFFSKEHARAVELVWEKEKDKILPEVEELLITGDEKSLENELIAKVALHLGEKWSNTKFRRRIIKILSRDARRINRYILAVSRFNGSRNWYVANYFKNYYFGIEGNILETGISYDKRLRFRFRVPQTLSPMPEELDKYHRKVFRRLDRLASHFAEVNALDMPYHRFEMNRVRYLSDYDLNLDLGVLEVSKGRGLLLEWKPAETFLRTKGLIPGMTPAALRNLANFFEHKVPDAGPLRLSQIRLSGSLEKNLSLLFFSVSKARDVEYHYRRKL